MTSILTVFTSLSYCKVLSLLLQPAGEMGSAGLLDTSYRDKNIKFKINDIFR